MAESRSADLASPLICSVLLCNLALLFIYSILACVFNGSPSSGYFQLWSKDPSWCYVRLSLFELLAWKKETTSVIIHRLLMSTWLGHQLPPRCLSAFLFFPLFPLLFLVFVPHLFSPLPIPLSFFLSCKRCRLCSDQQRFLVRKRKLLREDKILSVVTTDSDFASNVSGPSSPALLATRVTSLSTEQQSLSLSPVPASLSCLDSHVACE